MVLQIYIVHKYWKLMWRWFNNETKSNQIDVLYLNKSCGLEEKRRIWNDLWFTNSETEIVDLKKLPQQSSDTIAIFNEHNRNKNSKRKERKYLVLKN
jgi:hypothetical protein